MNPGEIGITILRHTPEGLLALGYLAFLGMCAYAYIGITKSGTEGDTIVTNPYERDMVNKLRPGN